MAGLGYVPRSIIDRYNGLLENLADRTSTLVERQLSAVGTNDPDAVKAVTRRLVLTGDRAVAGIDSQFYQAARRAAIGEAGEAPVSQQRAYSDESIDRAVDAMYRQHGERDDGGRWVVTDPDAFVADLSQFVNRTINEASKRHMEDYGARDKRQVRYARVPSGAETCAWCWALAGLGFQYKSIETASHSHAHCDCAIVPSWGGTGVEGYDPEKYANMFRAARDDMREGRISPELRQRINTEAATNRQYSRGWNGVLAVMREKYGLS